MTTMMQSADWGTAAVSALTHQKIEPLVKDLLSKGNELFSDLQCIIIFLILVQYLAPYYTLISALSPFNFLITILFLI